MQAAYIPCILANLCNAQNDGYMSRLSFIRSPLKMELIKAGGATFVLRIGSILAGLLSSVVLARVLGPAELGAYAFVYAIISLLALPVLFGLPTLITRETAKAEANEDWPRMKSVWYFAIRILLIGSLGIISMSVLVLFLLRHHIENLTFNTFLYGLCLIPLLAFTHTIASALRGLRRMAWGQLPHEIIRPMALCAIMSALAWHHDTLTAINAMVSHLIAAALAFIISLAAFHSFKPALISNAEKTSESFSKWFKALLPLSIISGTIMLTQQTDIIMLGFWVPNETIGLYKVAVTSATAALVGTNVANLVISPYIARFHAQHNTAYMQLIMAAAAAFCFIFTMCVLLVFAGYGESILSLLFGETYRPSNSYLLILMLGHAVYAFFGPIGALLFMADQEKAAMKILIILAVVNIAMNALLIPLYDAHGAAIATSFSMGLSAICFAILGWKRLGVHSTAISLLWSYKSRKKNITQP